jgi:hypothetical protein
MIRKLTKAKKARRREINHAAVMAIYARARQRGSADYLAVNQASDPAQVAKIQAEAQERRNRRNAKRAKHWNGRVSHDTGSTS